MEFSRCPGARVVEKDAGVRQSVAVSGTTIDQKQSAHARSRADSHRENRGGHVVHGVNQCKTRRYTSAWARDLKSNRVITLVRKREQLGNHRKGGLKVDLSGQDDQPPRIARWQYFLGLHWNASVSISSASASRGQPIRWMIERAEATERAAPLSGERIPAL